MSQCLLFVRVSTVASPALPSYRVHLSWASLACLIASSSVDHPTSYVVSPSATIFNCSLYINQHHPSPRILLPQNRRIRASEPDKPHTWRATINQLASKHPCWLCSFKPASRGSIPTSIKTFRCGLPASRALQKFFFFHEQELVLHTASSLKKDEVFHPGLCGHPRGLPRACRRPL